MASDPVDGSDGQPRPTAPGVARALETLRVGLLDVGKRNPLINAPVGKGRGKRVQLEDERSDQIFDILAVRGKRMAFEPSQREADEEVGGEMVPLPFAEELPVAALAEHHTDTKLRTNLTQQGLQSKLLSIYRDAREIEEEQGVNVLFLALGFLLWYESESSDVKRYAPLVLLPVDLQRDSSRGQFKLVHRDQDMEPNLSLRAMLADDFQLTLPDLPEGGDWRPTAYHEAVQEAVSLKPRWRVLPDLIELRFFSFAKFLMWKDLAPDGEFGEAGNPLLDRLLVGGAEDRTSIIAPDENLDQRFADPKELGHILDADASQTQVVAAARAGRNLVVQGPPGTGKSQTIANIIGGAAADGKRVLFVAEKRAALDVVHDRLEKCGLGPLCLELHSHKANRKHVYEELGKTLGLGRPTAPDAETYEQVRSVRDDLNRMSALLHEPDQLSGDTPYGIIGMIADLTEGGCPAPDFSIPNSDAWGRKECAQRLEATAALAALTDEHGSEARHLWRGATKRLNPIERRRLEWALSQAATCLETLRTSLERVPSPARWVGCERISDVGAALQQLEALQAMPPSVHALLREQGLVDRPRAALELCEQILVWQQGQADLLTEVIESALEIEWDQVRLVIAARGRSLFRWLNGGYRDAVARLKSVFRTAPPNDLPGRLAVLDRLLESRAGQRAIAKQSELGRQALGTAWREEDTDVDSLLPPLRWIAEQAERMGSGEQVRSQCASIRPEWDFSDIAVDLSGVHQGWAAAWQNVADAVGLDLKTAFGQARIDDVAFEAVAGRLRLWIGGLESIEGWHRLNSAARHASELGLDQIRARIADGRLPTDHARQTLEFVRAEAVWNRMCREQPRLNEIDGADRTSKVERFKDLDQRLQALTSHEIAMRHFDALPHGSSGQIGIVRGEIGKKTRHMRLRTLLDRAGEAVATIKPVFLMSPLSVAQYLKRGGLTFDMLLIDEASQVRPADAMGGILRSKQIVVVGDQKQMPPTSFFDRQVGGADEAGTEEDEAEIQAAQVGDMESILSLCDARAMPGGMLRWHYRSRHPSLIQVSNHEFYDNGLVCPPSPDQAGKTSGLTFSYVDGQYDRGKKRNNPIEAEAVAEAVLQHARRRPEQTLGVVALSVAQRDSIRNKLEWMRGEYPELEAFCKEGREEPFFVKNLENVQGDERDVIFISVGYGKDAGGYMSQNFGPVSSEGGERRLNVLFTRAKRRCRVFASIRHGDIRVDVTKQAGPRVLKRFLKYAETGELDIPVLTGAEMDSPFEEAVAKALQGHGYNVAAQVGSSGFKIDLAVYDPDDQGRFLLAIECDGARYHSSSWARERDRLRQSVLEGKGWTFHRIWSTDWFYGRSAEMQKLLDAIDRARSADGPKIRPPAKVDGPVVVREAPIDRPPPERVKYVEASFPIKERAFSELHEMSADVLAGYVTKIVEAEGPVHVDEVGRRLSRLWGYKRAGSRIRNAVDGAVRRAIRASEIRHSLPDQTSFLESCDAPEHPKVRDRSDVNSSLRSPEMLPPTELRRAILEAVTASIAIRPGDCAADVARMLGFKSTSAQLRACIEQEASALVEMGTLALVDGELRLP
ncbi:MAG: DUF3320 domain-containing protein [Bryobacterales bacterium]|nr:DUF3320 domain-containing protein [Bryobacterales bacterium]